MRTLFIALLVGSSVSAAAQQPSNQVRAGQIAAAFSKHKSVVKEHRGVTREKYKDVMSEPVVRQGTRAYAGSYEVADVGYVISIQVGNNGSVHASGHEAGQESRSFELQNARIEGALLTGTKVYQDGASERFEGVFMNRTERSSPVDPGVTTFGLGVMLAAPIELGGMTYDKLFYQLKR